MRLLTGRPVTGFRFFTALVTLGGAFATIACDDDSEKTRTTNSLSDAGLDASADAAPESDEEDAGTSTLTSSTARNASSNTTTAATTSEPRTSAPVDAGEPAETFDAAVTTVAPDSSIGATTTQSTTTSSSSDQVSTSEPLPASCGNGDIDGDEMCCRASDINAALEARFAAAELILNGDLGCAPPQQSEENNISYELCGGECGTDVGCAVSATNVELTYDPSAKRFNGIADVVIDGSVELSLAALNQTVSCDTAHVLFEEVTFTGDLVTEIGQEQTTVDVRNLSSRVGLPVVTGCAQGNVITAAFLLMQGPVETAVSEAVEQALEGTIAQPVECPY